MTARAIIDGWDIPVEKRAEIVQVLVDIASDDTNKPRDRNSAAKALMSLPRMQIEAAKLSLERQKFKQAQPRLVENTNNQEDELATLEDDRPTGEGDASAEVGVQAEIPAP